MEFSISVRLLKSVLNYNFIVLPFGYFTQMSSVILEYGITSIQLHISRIEVKASIHIVKIRVLLVSELYIKLLSEPKGLSFTLVKNLFSKAKVTVQTWQGSIEVPKFLMSNSIRIIHNNCCTCPKSVLRPWFAISYEKKQGSYPLRCPSVYLLANELAAHGLPVGIMPWKLGCPLLPYMDTVGSSVGSGVDCPWEFSHANKAAHYFYMWI